MKSNWAEELLRARERDSVTQPVTDQPDVTPDVTASVTEPVTVRRGSTETVTPGDVCPLCGHRIPMTVAQRKRKQRQRK